MKTTQLKSVVGLFFFGLGAFQLPGQALLWEISGNSLSETSYLFGSIHIQDKRVFQLDSEVWNRFEKASNFALEFDLESVNQHEIAMRMMMSKPYSEILSKEDYQLLENVIKTHTQIPFFAIQQMKPFFVSALISQSVLAMDEDHPLDLFLLKKARESHKTILELESFDEQINVIDNIPFDEQLEGLLKLIRNPDLKNSLETEVENLVITYLSQDDTKLYQLILESDESETFMKRFLIERNHNMFKKIQTFIAKESTFIVVGAGHLGGDEGLVQLLKNAGYTLTPIKF
ncbi:MAG: TraB/GumN family protein [Bacteroidales bacterium]|nr:TraB/GumN family protein [Bacteroidales bacterium]